MRPGTRWPAALLLLLPLAACSDDPAPAPEATSSSSAPAATPGDPTATPGAPSPTEPSQQPSQQTSQKPAPSKAPEADEVVVDWPHRYLEAEVDPARLDLGARTPEETAISIAAEIIAGQWGGSGEPLGATDGRIHHQRAVTD